MLEPFDRHAATTPTFVAVGQRVRETHDVFTLKIPIQSDSVLQQAFSPGQFNMLTAFGVGEAAISISGDTSVKGELVHTIRAVGPVTRALTNLEANDLVGIRGPFGAGWPVNNATGHDVLIIAGGVGLAPLRSVVYYLLQQRPRYGRVALLYGARHPSEMLYKHELDQWRRTPGLQVRTTADHADTDWAGDIGVVTRLLPKVRFDPLATVAMICGPEIMIQVTATALQDMGVSSKQIYVSLERNMKCAVGLCGHCQFGPHFICKDGPVLPLDRITTLLNLREI